MTALLFLVVAFCGWLATPTVARAQDLDQAVAALAAGDYGDKMRAIEALAAQDHPRVGPILEALHAGRLHTREADGKVVIAERRGRSYVLSDPLTGEALGEAARRELGNIRINNRLRGVISAALSRARLFSDDPARRIEAAEEMIDNRSPEFAPLLERALQDEANPAVRDKMEVALAAVRLASDDASERVAAVGTLAGSLNSEVRTLLANLLRQDGDGRLVEEDPEVRAAAESALAAIDRNLTLLRFGENLFQGLSLGSVLLLAAIGLAITFGVMGVINLAHGELIMLGAYTTFVVQEAFRAYAPGALDLSLVVAIPAAFLVGGAAGVAIERGIVRFLYGRPLETLLMTFGLSLILQQLVRSLFGPTNRRVSSPSWMQGAIELPGDIVLTHNRIWIIVFAALVFVGLLLLLRFSSFGLHMRTVTQNRDMAAAMGIRTGRVDALAFGLGSGIAGMAGVAISQIDNVSPNLGQGYIIDSFLVVVFGGVGNLYGTLVGATTLGVVNKFLEPYAGAVLGKILVLGAIILFIQRRPRGLFALRGRAAEA